MKRKELEQVIKEAITKTFNKLNEQVDDISALDELLMYIENNSDLYRQQYIPIIKNLVTKVAKGVYEYPKSVKLFHYLVDNGAKRYAKEHDDIRNWNKIFSKQVRSMAAKDLADQFYTEAKLGNYDEYIPKKYSNNSLRDILSDKDSY